MSRLGGTISGSLEIIVAFVWREAGLIRGHPTEHRRFGVLFCATCFCAKPASGRSKRGLVEKPAENWRKLLSPPKEQSDRGQGTTTEALGKRLRLIPNNLPSKEECRVGHREDDSVR